MFGYTSKKSNLYFFFNFSIFFKLFKIPCSFKKWAEPWKYGSKLALRPHFKDLGKKAVFNVSGGIQGELFQFFRYEIDKMLKDNPQRQESIKLKVFQNKNTH